MGAPPILMCWRGGGPTLRKSTDPHVSSLAPCAIVVSLWLKHVVIQCYKETQLESHTCGSKMCRWQLVALQPTVSQKWPRHVGVLITVEYRVNHPRHLGRHYSSRFRNIPLNSELITANTESIFAIHVGLLCNLA